MKTRLTALKKAAPAFAALGDPLRLGLVTRLSHEGPLSTKCLQVERKITRQAITKHLQILEGAGIVRSLRVGRDRLWQIEHAKLAEVTEFLDRISAQWDARLDRLRLLVEDKPT